MEYGHDLDMKKEEGKEGDMAKNNNNGKVINSQAAMNSEINMGIQSSV